MKRFTSFTITLLCFLIVVIHGCSSTEIGQSKDVAPETIYQHYSINYNEGDEVGTVNACFRFAGINGTTLVLSDPSSISLDGVKLPVDSSDFEGAFYKQGKKAVDFFGDHNLRFTDIQMREYNNKFSFNRFKLANLPVSASKNTTLHIQFEPLLIGPDDHIELESIETDSAFSISYTGRDKDSFISIPVEDLQRQQGSQLKLVATLYRKQPLQNSTKEGGIIEMVYALKPVSIKLDAPELSKN